MKILAKFFWRIALPFLLALATATWEFLSSRGDGGGVPSGSNDLERHLMVGLYAAIFCVSLGTAFRNSLRWGKEAEEYESRLKEADEFEKSAGGDPVGGNDNGYTNFSSRSGQVWHRHSRLCPFCFFL